MTAYADAFRQSIQINFHAAQGIKKWHKRRKNSDPGTSRIEDADMAENAGYHLISAWEHQMRHVVPQRASFHYKSK